MLVIALLFAFAESALGVGALVPGEAVVLALGASATGTQESALLLGAVSLGGVAGDHVGYALGRRHSNTVRDSKMVVRLGVHHWDRATSLVHRHGALALVATRLVPVVRTLTPAVTGASAVPYRLFATGSVLGSLLWAGVWVGVGSTAAPLLTHTVRQAGPGAVVATAAGITLAALLLLRRRVSHELRLHASPVRRSHP